MYFMAIWQLHFMVWSSCFLWLGAADDYDVAQLFAMALCSPCLDAIFCTDYIHMFDMILLDAVVYLLSMESIITLYNYLHMS